MIPRNVECVEVRAFSDCDKMDKISFQDGSLLEDIGNRCFSGSRLKEFRSPPGMRKIGNEAFSECKSLKRVILNDGLQ